MVQNSMRMPIYVASRASLPERVEMWKGFRAEGWNIISSWIDESGEGQSLSLPKLWDRIWCEIAICKKLILYVETLDFPLKGALIEVGMALGRDKPVIVCAPGVVLDPKTYRPLGSWVMHRNVVIVSDVRRALENTI